jgi:hypothetical protein
MMWSSNGNLDAGRGSKTTLSFPPLQAIYDQDDFQSVDLGGFVSGAGIGVLKTSSAATSSDLFLLAPRGTIDAGTAGVRSSGAVVLGANLILNATNIEASGRVVGLPTFQAPNVSVLTSAPASNPPPRDVIPQATENNSDRPSIIIVEFLGFGGGDSTPASGQPADEPQHHKDERQSNLRQQDPRSRFQVIGVGDITDAEAREMTELRRREIGR